MFAPAASHSKPAQHRYALLASLLALALGLGGCASTPMPQTPGRAAPISIDTSRDGPAAVIPPDLALVPDAEPRVEPIRAGGPNKPYEIMGQRYEPITSDQPLIERGLASWYGRKFHGKPTSTGEIYNMYAMSAAHPTMPLPSYARVRNPANGREVIVRVNDRGPFHAGRIIDLSYTAALKLDLLRGVAPVEVERLTFDDIRSGAWRRDNPAPVYLASQPSGAPERSSTASGADPALLLADAKPAPTAVDANPSTPPPAVASQAGAGRGFWLQLGAFSQLGGAEQLRQQLVKQLDWIAPLLAVFTDSAMHRLQAGPYPSREQAQLAAERVRDATRMQPLLVQR